MNTSVIPQGVGTLKKWWDSEDRILQCTLPFQRHSGMWNSITKSLLIWSILANAPLPALFFLKDKVGEDSKGKNIFHYQILDGQQRLTNIFDFMNDEWELHGATPEVELDGTVYDLAGMKFSDLSEECKDAIRGFRFSIQCVENYTMEEAERLFYNLNSGVALSAIQKAKSKLGNDIMMDFNKILNGSFFTQAVNITEKQAKNEDDLLMLIQSLLILDNAKNDRDFKTIATATCLSYADEFRTKYTSELKEELEKLFGFLNQAFSTKCKFLRKNNVPIVIACARTALSEGVKSAIFKSFIDFFSNGVYPTYEEASGSGNVKAPKVLQRLRVMFLAMCEYCGMQPENVLRPFSMTLPLYTVEKEITDTEGVVSDSDENPELPLGAWSSDEPSEGEPKFSGGKVFESDILDRPVDIVPTNKEVKFLTQEDLDEIGRQIAEGRTEPNEPAEPVTESTEPIETEGKSEDGEEN